MEDVTMLADEKFLPGSEDDWNRRRIHVIAIDA
jgi:hypothetical protein